MRPLYVMRKRLCVQNFPSFWEGLSLRRSAVQLEDVQHLNFPSFWEGLSLRPLGGSQCHMNRFHFPSFWEGLSLRPTKNRLKSRESVHFPSFWEGLSLRPETPANLQLCCPPFPFLLGGTFIEASVLPGVSGTSWVGFPFLLGGTFIEAEKIASPIRYEKEFPFLLGGTFIEAGQAAESWRLQESHFPSFWEGLSLRLAKGGGFSSERWGISLPFGRDFH